jgi:putative phosphoesterase
MRVALISDLHGNEIALEAVLKQARQEAVDRIVCLGDVATLGPQPSAVIARLKDLGCACILGNHDEFLLDPELIGRYTEAPIIVESVSWCRARLTSEELAFVRGFSRTAEIPLEHGANLLVFHGTPRSNMQDLLAHTPADAVDQMLTGARATVLAGGHTHIQMLRQHRGTLLVNPGSVGMPFKEFVAGRPPTVMAHAEYAIVASSPTGIGVTLRRVDLERAALRAAAQRSDLPLAPMLAAEYA